MEEEVWPYFESFEEFLCLVWAHLRLPPPTRRQRRIAHRLQKANGGWEDIIRAFRGIGKSYITAAFVLWRLMRNPYDEKILVVSATGGKAKEFVAMVKSLLNSMDILSFLRGGRRDMADMFDVAGASISQSYSLKAASITGQITGSRATLIVADDIEIENNSKTEEARERLMRATSEFEAIKMPGADVVYLGTPQTEESIYNRLVIERGYSCYTIPARFPAQEKMKGYLLKRNDGTIVNILADDLVNEFEAGLIKHGAPTDPERFDDSELLLREAKGRSFFALQYQLDTSLSDAERYPLRTQDLIVFETNALKAPLTIQWGRDSDRKNVIQDIPNLGFTGDHLLRPLFLESEWRDYDGSLIYVDPSGRGKDETAWTVMKTLNGMFFVLKVGGHVGDPAEAMHLIAMDAKRFNVSEVTVEPNFGQGMWVAAFQPILAKVWPGGCTITESAWAKGQKEARIIDTLEPVMTQHRLVISESVLREDAREDAESRNYSLLYQLTHITRERGALAHDDRLDSLAGAVAHFLRAMSQDVVQSRQAMLESEMEAEIEAYWESLEDPSWHGRRPSMRGRQIAPGEYQEVYLSR